MSPAAIYRRDAELEQLRQLVSRRHSFLLHGPAGVGKTLLVKQLAVEVPEMVYCDQSSSSQLVFRKLAAELFARKNRHVLQACGTSGLNAIKEKSAVSIRGVVTEALRDANHWIVLDHLKPPSHSFGASLKDLCNGTQTPLIAVARSAHMEDVGFLLHMFSDRSDKHALRNFDTDTAREFAMRTAQEMHLNAANQDEAIQQIVHYSKGSPGAIIAMLHMAASPKYVTQQHVKLSPLYIDFRLTWGATHG
jgi:DNA polymerase III delta prime subunit